jgi:heat shock protein HslJ
MSYGFVKYVLLFIIFLFIGCSSSKQETNSTNLENTNWKVISVTGSSYDYSAGRSIILQFGLNNTASGKSICNSYGFSYDVKGNSLELSKMYATDMACDGLEYESYYFKMLNTVSKFKISGSKLLLKDSNNKTLITLVKN